MANKCGTCNSCRKWYTLENRQYQCCALCLRVWKILGGISVEVFEGELDHAGNNILERFRALVKEIGVF
jgi:hypothetical protein